MVVKTQQISDFARLEAACRKQHGTMRGMVLVMERDNDRQSNRIGKPIILDNGAMFDFENEATLLRDWGSEPVIENGKVIRPENVDITPFDYDRILPLPDPEELARRFGGTMPQGNASGECEVLGKTKRKTRLLHVDESRVARGRATAGTEDGSYVS